MNGTPSPTDLHADHLAGLIVAKINVPVSGISLLEKFYEKRLSHERSYTVHVMNVSLHYSYEGNITSSGDTHKRMSRLMEDRVRRDSSVTELGLL